MNFRAMIVELAPSWLRDGNAKALLQTLGQMVDNFLERLTLGMKAHFPDYAPDDVSLAYLGNDRLLDRGPNEVADNFRVRLRGAVDSARNRGGARTLLAQLAAYFDGTATPGLRLVYAPGVWHVYDWTNEVTIKINIGDNWNWDNGDHWWWGWVIIDGASLGWTSWNIGDDGVTFDDGHILGSTATETDVQSIQRIVQKWKPAHVYVCRIIVTLADGVFDVNMSAEGTRERAGPWTGPEFHFLRAGKANPGGEYGSPENFDEDATYWLGGGEEPS